MKRDSVDEKLCNTNIESSALHWQLLSLRMEGKFCGYFISSALEEIIFDTLGNTSLGGQNPKHDFFKILSEGDHVTHQI